ncbi:hypothetical protein ACLKA7_000826 [Drosophila subpalustris]
MTPGRQIAKKAYAPPPPPPAPPSRNKDSPPVLTISRINSPYSSKDPYSLQYQGFASNPCSIMETALTLARINSPYSSKDP